MPENPPHGHEGSARTLVVLGCDGSYPGPGGAASGYLVLGEASAIWLDAGPGTFARLQQHCDPGSLDALVLSHEHPDHWTDLEAFGAWHLLSGPRPPLPVYAPPGLRRRSYYAEYPGLAWVDTEPSMRVDVGSLTLSFCATDHGPPTLAVRVDPSGSGDGLGTSLAYSGDSGPDWSVEELGSGIGTVLCEATYTKEHEGAARHMSGRQAGAMARSAGVGRLVVTHRWPTVSAGALGAEAEEAFGRPLDQASVGAVFGW